MIKFNARGKDFYIKERLLEKYQNSLLYLLSNTNMNSNITVSKINDSIYLDINPKYLRYIYDIYNIDSYIDENIDIFAKHDLEYLGFDVNVNYQIIPTLLHPIISPKKNINDKNQILKNNTNNKYCNVHCADGVLVTIDLANNYLMDTKLGYILYGNDTDSIITITDDYINVMITIDSLLLHNILSIIRDGYHLYHQYIYDTQIKDCYETDNIFCNDEIKFDDFDSDNGDIDQLMGNIYTLGNYVASHSVKINDNMNQLAKKIEENEKNETRYQYKRLTKYLELYGIICQADIEELNNRIYRYHNYHDIYRQSDDYRNLFDNTISCSYGSSTRIQYFIADLSHGCLSNIMRPFKIRFVSNFDVDKMKDADKEKASECIANYFYGL